jgi:hypothetical protein
MPSDQPTPASPLPWPMTHDKAYVTPEGEGMPEYCALGVDLVTFGDASACDRKELRADPHTIKDIYYAHHACNAHPALVARVAELEAALGDVIAACEHANFANGVTGSTGGMDEGEVRSWEAIERARKALTLNTKGRGIQ